VGAGFGVLGTLGASCVAAVLCVSCLLGFAGCAGGVEIRGLVVEAPPGGFPLVLAKNLDGLPPVRGAAVNVEVAGALGLPPTITDGAGRFRFRFLGIRPPDVWKLVIDAPGFPEARVEVTGRGADTQAVIVLHARRATDPPASPPGPAP
jgi:hypothetical protein